MNKLKWSLRAITVCCAILPVLVTVLAYQDNMLGVLVPPQISDAMSGNDQALQEVLPDFSNMSDVEPTFNNDFQFNPDEGTYGFSVDVTSPLDTPVTFNSLSVTVTDDNGTVLGTITLGDPVTLVPGETSTIPIEGALSQEFVTLLQNSGVDPADPQFDPETLGDLGLDLDSIHVIDVDLDVGGVQIHMDELNPNELFGLQESGSTEEP